MNTTNNTSKLVILGLMTGILLLMAYTPLGYLNIGPLAITFNVIPVAIAAITLGPAGGAAIGAVFGMTSFLQCIGIGGSSAMGAMLFSINPFLAFVQRFVPRMLDGLLLGYIFQFVRRRTDVYMASLVTGFCSAFLNTVFFMTALVVLFGNTEYAGADRWKKYHPVRMRFRRNQCSMRDGIVHNPHRCSRCSALPGKICTGSGKKQGVRQYDFGIGYRKYECGSRLYCGWENPLYRADGDRQWENRA